MRLVHLIFALLAATTTLVHGASHARSPSRLVSPTAAANGNLNHRAKLQVLQKYEEELQKKKLSPASSLRLALRGGAVEDSVTNAVLGSAVLCAIEKGVKEVLNKANIKFPPMLGGCIFLFLFLLLTDMVAPSVANGIFEALSPSAALLAKWLPMFFVPGLALLPLSPSVGGPKEVATLLAVVALGLVYTAATVAYSVLAIRTATGAIAPTATEDKKNGNKKSKAKVAPKKGKKKKEVAAVAATAAAPAKPFTQGTLNAYSMISLVSGAACIWALRTNNDYATPIQTVFVSAFTVMAYVWSARLPSGYVSIVHPLVTTAVLILGLAKAMTYAVPSMEYLDFFHSYKAGTLNPMEAGAGDLFLYLLGPSVVCFAVSMYSRRALLANNLLVVMVAMIVSSVGSLFSTAAFCRAIMLGGDGDSGRMIRLSILPRNVTTALAMVITELLDGDIGIAVAIVCVTGVLGATYGKKLLNAMGITDPITRGLAIGSSAQGLGVASIVDEPDAFPFAAMSMVLTAISATTLVTIPSFRDALSSVAVGAAKTPAARKTAEKVVQAAATVVANST